MLELEQQVQNKGFTFVVGVDEAGRGPLAGPVVAAAVVLKSTQFENRIGDSKKLTPRQRERAFIEIFDKAYVGIGIMSEMVIDKHNILRATHMAMNSAIHEVSGAIPNASCENTFVLIDGNSFRPDHAFPYECIVEGDKKSMSIACASIVAKVYRDRAIAIYDRVFPQYGFAQHKGYPTKLHREAIKKHGFSPIHRRTFSVKI